MKNLDEFKTFKMSKAQMNTIAGGAHCNVTLIDTDGSSVSFNGEYPSGMSKDEAYGAIHKKYDTLYDSRNVIVNC